MKEKSYSSLHDNIICIMSDDNNDSRTPFFKDNKNAMRDAAKEMATDIYVLQRDIQAKNKRNRYNPATDKDE